MNGGIVLSVVICIIVLTLRSVASQGTPQPRRTVRSRIRYIRILIAALLALAAVGYRLQKHAYELDGKKDYEASFVERMVMALSK